MKKNFNLPTLNQENYSARRRIVAGVMAGAALFGASCSASEKEAPTVTTEVPTHTIETKTNAAAEARLAEIKERYADELEKTTTHAKKATAELIELSQEPGMGMFTYEEAPYKDSTDMVGFWNQRSPAHVEGYPDLNYFVHAPADGSEAELRVGSIKNHDDNTFSSLDLSFSLDHAEASQVVALRGSATRDDIARLLESDNTKLVLIDSIGNNASIYGFDRQDSENFYLEELEPIGEEMYLSDPVGGSELWKETTKGKTIDNSAEAGKMMRTVIETYKTR